MALGNIGGHRSVGPIQGAGGDVRGALLGKVAQFMKGELKFPEGKIRVGKYRAPPQVKTRVVKHGTPFQGKKRVGKYGTKQAKSQKELTKIQNKIKQAKSQKELTKIQNKLNSSKIKSDDKISFSNEINERRISIYKYNKNELEGKWLEIPNKNVGDLLKEKGYEPLPDDYINHNYSLDELKIVESNKKIVDKLLKNEGTLMKKTLKPGVDKMVSLTRQMMSEGLAAANGILGNDSPCSIDELLENSENLPEGVKAIVKDLGYLKEMLDMENKIKKSDVSEKKKGLEMTNAVPPSGLMMAALKMIENEVDTVLEMNKNQFSK